MSSFCLPSSSRANRCAPLRHAGTAGQQVREADYISNLDPRKDSAEWVGFSKWHGELHRTVLRLSSQHASQTISSPHMTQASASCSPGLHTGTYTQIGAAVAFTTSENVLKIFKLHDTQVPARSKRQDKVEPEMRGSRPTCHRAGSKADESRYSSLSRVCKR